MALHHKIFENLGIDNVEGVSTESGRSFPGCRPTASTSSAPDVDPAAAVEQAAFSEPEFDYRPR